MTRLPQSKVERLSDHLKDRHDKVSVVGHSIGALTALASCEQRFDALVTWDGSHPEVIDPANWPDLWIWEPSLKCWQFENGVVSLIDARLVESFMALDAEAAATSMKKPVKFIGAGTSRNAEFAKKLHEFVEATPKDLHIIEGADHGFTADKHVGELLTETINWLDVHGR